MVVVCCMVVVWRVLSGVCCALVWGAVKCMLCMRFAL